MKDLLDIYKGKTVLVTGHTGFKGSWMSIWLNELGAKVVGYSLDPVTSRDNFSLSNIADKVIDIRGDIRDEINVISVFEKYKPEIVFHLAAQPIVKFSYEYPKYTYDVNIMGTINILEAIRSTDETRAGVIVTSDKCYENREWVWGYRENDPMGGYDPYSSSKGCVELLVSSYRNSYFNTSEYAKHRKIISSVRAGNVIGGGDWSKYRIVPDSIDALESNKDIIVRNPKAVRPFQHVLEPLSGYLLLGAKLLSGHLEYSGPWNFGPNPDSIATVESLVNKIIKYWGNGSWAHPNIALEVPHETTLLSLDISKAKYSLNWNPRWHMDKTVEKTVEWYKNYRTTPIYDLCVSQINEYCKT